MICLCNISHHEAPLFCVIGARLQRIHFLSNCSLVSFSERLLLWVVALLVCSLVSWCQNPCVTCRLLYYKYMWDLICGCVGVRKHPSSWRYSCLNSTWLWSLQGLITGQLQLFCLIPHLIYSNYLFAGGLFEHICRGYESGLERWTAAPHRCMNAMWWVRRTLCDPAHDYLSTMINIHVF